VAIPRRFRAARHPVTSARSFACPQTSEESVVFSAVGRYILEAILPTGLMPGGAATHPCIIGNSLCRRAASQRRGLQVVFEPEPSVFDATPRTDFRDAMISNAPGCLAPNVLPHSTASPAGPVKAATVRLGVLSAWPSACLSTPPTPKKPG
jgi:hypothetical protein